MNILNDLKMTKIIDNTEFLFKVELNNNKIFIRSKASDSYFQPLCEVIMTSWSYDHKKLLNSVLAEHGQSFEGDVSFSYYNDYPEELEPGVTIDFGLDEILVNEQMFKKYVIGFVSYYFEVTKKLNLEYSQLDEEISLLNKLIN